MVPPIANGEWRDVQQLVDAINEFGTDPSGYMRMGIDEAVR